MARPRMPVLFPPEREPALVREFLSAEAPGFFVEVGANDAIDYLQLAKQRGNEQAQKGHFDLRAVKRGLRQRQELDARCDLQARQAPAREGTRIDIYAVMLKFWFRHRCVSVHDDEAEILRKFIFFFYYRCCVCHNDKKFFKIISPAFALFSG